MHILICAALAAAVAAEAPAPAADRSVALQKLADCGALTDPAARLACYDREAAALDRAEAGGEVVVMDRAQIRQARRQVFGFDTSAFELFDRKDETEQVAQIALVIERAWLTPEGDWVMAMSGGEVWRQIDGHLRRPPEVGGSAEIRRAALGSYLLKLDGQKAIRARREK